MKNILLKFFCLLPLNLNYIVLESFPNFSGSVWLIYKELCRRNVDKSYKIVWMVERDFSPCNNVVCVPFFGKLSLKQKIIKLWILCKAKVIVDSNRYVKKLNSKTFRLYTQHAAPLKKVFSYTHALGNVDAILSLSEEMSDLEKTIWPTAKNKFWILGYPLNDCIFESCCINKLNFWTKCLGRKQTFKKIIGWLPTYRQHRTDDKIGSSYIYPFGIPLMNARDDFEKINAILKEKNILLAVQMHHAQADNFPKQIYSNIVLIPPDLKQEMEISNANLMCDFDAMITDYSGAYHEYLLLNRPIALSIDDYDEYAKNPGFSIDYFDLIKGVYLKDTSDLVHFIEDVANGVDSAKDEREKSMRRIHKYIDGQSTKRVVDFLIEKANL